MGPTIIILRVVVALVEWLVFERYIFYRITWLKLLVLSLKVWIKVYGRYI